MQSPLSQNLSSATRPLRAGAVLLGALLGTLAGACARTTTARDVYESLPDVAPARSEGEPGADARCCLVHVRQRHLPPLRGADARPDRARAWVADVNRHQREVYRMLRGFADAGLRSVFAEGVYAEDPWDDRVSVEQDYLESLRAIERALGTADRPYEDAYRRLRDGTRGVPAEEDVAALPTDALRRRARVLDEVRYAPGAEYVLALEGRLDVLPAERWGLIASATAAYDAAPDGASHAARADPALFDDREDALLALVAARGEALAVVLFGGLHDLSDNVVRWNAAHPDERIDLVVVTPTSY